MTAPIPPRARRPDHLQHWRMYLQSGFDFFGDLEGIGLSEKTVTRAQAKEAWLAYGREIMASFEPTTYRKRPWGFEKFGAPK